MRREVVLSTLCGLVATIFLAVLIVVGSRRLSHFDAALVGYTFATLFSVFGITYRYAMWLQRPATWMYWKRGWQLFLEPQHLLSNLASWAGRLFNAFVINRFIWRRGTNRGAAHWLIMWGCILAAAITFPLVFGWMHFAVEGQVRPLPRRRLRIRNVFISHSIDGLAPSSSMAWCGPPSW